MGLIPTPAVDNETGEYMVQEYEVMGQDGSVATRYDGIGERMTPVASLAASLSAEAGNGIPVAPGGRFRQPARAIRLVRAFNHLQVLSRERLDSRTKRN